MHFIDKVVLIISVLFSEIEYFIEVAECLSFTKAAENLFVSQPGLSKTISRLESKLNVQLFERSTRKVTLTEAGASFLVISKNYIEQCKSLPNRIMENEKISELRVGFSNFVDLNFMPTFLNSYKRKYPYVNLSSITKNAEEILSDIKASKIDIATISSYAIRDASFNSCLIAKHPLKIVLWKGHPLATKKIIRLSDLKNEQFVFLPPSINKGGDTLVELCKEAGFSPNIVEMENDFHLMFLKVSQKKGIAFNLTLPNVEEYPELSLVNIDMSEFPQYEKMSGLSLVWLKNSKNPALLLFLRIVSQMISNQFENKNAF